jgi:UDP-N-acetylglucosamine--dolichyl-phosphate N-acetylglucosaminephosphotransferase
MLQFFAAAFFVTFVSTPILKNKLAEYGITGTDLHKAEKVEIPEMGGIAILLGFSISQVASYFFYSDSRLLIGLVVVMFIGAIGIVDGKRRLSAKQKVLSLSAVGLLLIPFSKPTFLGHDFGILYLIFVPIFFMFACNFTNMLAGFNGLEIGTGAIASFGMAAVAYLNGSTEGAILSGTMFCALLAFLYYNGYPAKVFPGDVGTLIIGAVLFTTMIISKIELFGAIIFAPYIVDAALKYLSVGVMTRESQTPTELRGGKLHVPAGSNTSLARLFIRRKSLREPEVVFLVWVVEAVCCAMAVGLAMWV